MLKLEASGGKVEAGMANQSFVRGSRNSRLVETVRQSECEVPPTANYLDFRIVTSWRSENVNQRVLVESDSTFTITLADC